MIAPCAAWDTAMKTERVELHPAYILHHHPYRNSSRLLEVFSRDYGRFGMIARGVSSKRSRLQGRLQPFRPLLLSWHSRGELATMRTAEPDGAPPVLSGAALMSGFYLNELLLRLTGRHVPYPRLFRNYHRTLNRLGERRAGQDALRLFECHLLQELGYGMTLDHEVEHGRPIQPEAHYCYHIERGPVELATGEPANGVQLAGSSLLALASGQFPDQQSRKDALRLMRTVLAFYLGSKPLRSRELFRSLKGVNRGTTL